MNQDTQVDELAPWLVVVLTLIGAVLRLLLLDHKGMWLDETWSVWLANQGVADMLQWIAHIDHHPPLYYLLLHYWIGLVGDAAYEARLLSALFSAGTIPLVYLTGKRLSGTVLGLAAALLLAFSPFHIRFAHEARMYTLLTFNAAVAIYALVRLLTDPRSARPIGSQFREYVRAWRAGPPEPDDNVFSYKDEIPHAGWRAWMARHDWRPIQSISTDLAWLVWVLFSAATLLSHNAALLFVGAAQLYVLGLMLASRHKPESPPAFHAPPWGNWLKAQIAILLLWSPWLPAWINQVGRVYQEFWLPQPGWDTVVGVLDSFLNASLPFQGRQIMVLWILYALALGLGLMHWRNRMARFFFLVVLFVVPLLGVLIVSLVRPVLVDRTLIWTTIPLFLLVGAGIAQLKPRLLLILAVGIVATNGLFATSDYFRFEQNEDWSSAAGYVALFAQQDDLVLFNEMLAQIPFDYYFERAEERYDLEVEKHGLPVDMLDSQLLRPRMTAGDIPRLLALIRGRERVWLVYSHDGYTDPMGLIPQTLASELTLLRQKDFYGGQVQLYGAR